LGGLDILVNYAGILRLSAVKDISLEDINALLFRESASSIHFWSGADC
jgi:NAD(P)-dependent dehydrogenase (short-subunit alcohol dehydrogenase family)